MARTAPRGRPGPAARLCPQRRFASGENGRQRRPYGECCPPPSGTCRCGVGAAEKGGIIGPTLILSEETGQPYTADNFRHVFRRIIATAAAGKPDLGVEADPSVAGSWFMWLRHTAVTRMAEAGCEIPEIVAVTGHTIRSAAQIIEHYLVRTGGMARAAFEKRLAHAETVTGREIALCSKKERHRRRPCGRRRFTRSQSSSVSRERIQPAGGWTGGAGAAPPVRANTLATKVAFAGHRASRPLEMSSESRWKNSFCSLNARNVKH